MGNIQRNIDNVEQWMQPVEVGSSSNPDDSAQVIHEARGVCLILGPWNFPLARARGPPTAPPPAPHSGIGKQTPK